MTVRVGKTSTYLANKWLTEIQNGTIPSYLALFSSDPQSAGSPLTVELAFNSYVRPLATWSLAGRILTTTNAQTWNTIPPGITIPYIGAFDALANGNLLFSGPVPVASASPLGYYDYTYGGYLTLAAGAYHFGLDN